MSELDRKEDYYVKADLIGENTQVCGVPCKIFLPERIWEKPYLQFKPNTSADAHKLMSLSGGKLKASIANVGLDQNVRATIEVQQVYFSHGGTTHWGGDLAEPYAHGDPQHLLITDHFGNPELQDKTEMAFWITPNELLTPHTSCTTSYTGNVSYERHGNVEFLIEGGIELTFERNFKAKHMDNGDLIQWSYLVANAELTTAATNFEVLQNIVLQHVDDFLLIASLAAGKRTACLGWTASDKASQVTYYRGNYAFPDCSEKGGIHDNLADYKTSKEFIETCYARFRAYPNQLALRSAICAAVPIGQHNIESEFLCRFAGLETLLSSFRRQEGLEHILAPTNWDGLKAYLRKCVKESTEPKLESRERDSIYKKLDELNRVSIREAFEIFCQKYEIDLSDLWPVFGDKGTIGLVEIRNKLIHGDPFSNELFHSLVVANMHLQATLERSLIRVLGWDIEKTRVAPAHLAFHFSHMNDFSLERKHLTDYIQTR
jgi:hypothetical protein